MNSIIMVAVIANLGVGSSTQIVDLGRAFQVLRHDTNQVEMCVSNYGKFGQDETGNNAGCWWPTGTDHTYIFGAGIWFGAIDSLTGDTLVTIGYNPYDGSSELAPGLNGMSVNHPCAIMYMYPDNWPPPQDTFPLAPLDVVSHQDSWCVYNDCDSAFHNPGDTRPIGIEVYQTVYEWTISEIEDVIFFVYDFKNTSGSMLHDCYVGTGVHCVLGQWSPNDRCCGIVERQYCIAGDTIMVDNTGYQWQEFEEPGTPPWFPGVIGFDLLQTPFDLVEGMDKDGDGILDQYERDSIFYVNNLPKSLWDVDNDGVPDWRDPSQWPQYGMTAFKMFSNATPGTDAERFLSMAGYNYLTGQYEPFDTIPLDPSDWWIIVQSSGPFDLMPDSCVSIIFAVMFADWHSLFMEADTALALIDRFAEDYYNMHWYLYTGVEEHFEFRILDCGLKILPNPVSNRGTIFLSLTTAQDVSLKLYDIAGRHVETLIKGRFAGGMHAIPFEAARLPQGTYFLVMESSCLRESVAVVFVR